MSRCELCYQTLLFNRQVLERHLSRLHEMAYSTYCERYLKKGPAPGPPHLSAGHISAVKMEASERAEGGSDHISNGAVKEEEIAYDEPAYEGPGGYQCPLPDCSFKTDLEVRLGQLFASISLYLSAI